MYVSPSPSGERRLSSDVMAAEPVKPEQVGGGIVLAVLLGAGFLWHQHNVDEYKKCQANYEYRIDVYNLGPNIDRTRPAMPVSSPCVKSWP